MAEEAAPQNFGYLKIVRKSFLSENFRPTIQKSGLKHILRTFWGKIEILSTHNLLWRKEEICSSPAVNSVRNLQCLLEHCNFLPRLLFWAMTPLVIRHYCVGSLCSHSPCLPKNHEPTQPDPTRFWLCRNSRCRNSGCRNSGCRNSSCRNNGLYPEISNIRLQCFEVFQHESWVTLTAQIWTFSMQSRWCVLCWRVHIFLFRSSRYATRRPSNSSRNGKRYDGHTKSRQELSGKPSGTVRNRQEPGKLHEW